MSEESTREQRKTFQVRNDRKCEYEKYFWCFYFSVVSVFGFQSISNND